MIDALVTAIADIDDEEACEIVAQALKDGVSTSEILSSCQEAMEIVGQRFEDREYFLPELIMSGEVLKEITEVIKPHLNQEKEGAPKLGTFVIGTVKGDIHDIGKDIVAFMMEVNGFEVYNLGVDVAPEQFVEAIAQYHPDIVALSGLLTVAFDAMKDTVAAIASAGCREQVKIMVGGGAVNEDIRVYAGADAYTASAVDAVAWAKAYVQERAS